MKTKLILQAVGAFLILALASGLLPDDMSAAEVVRHAAPLQPAHVTAHGVPEDFIFASGYTWLGRD
jgi:hypothetical protein